LGSGGESVARNFRDRGWNPLHLFVYVPQDDRLAGARISAGAATIKEDPKRGVLMVTFPGRNEPVQWDIEFKKR
jgi:hypothetical protein